MSVVLDNARYLGLETAATLEIELCFLPPYSPNLNLIECLWKFIKKECLYSTYYATFTPFKAAISTHKSALDSLLTLRFQRFDKAQFVAF
jgi:transposase